MYVAQSTNKYPDFPIDRNLGVEIRFRISRSIAKSEIRISQSNASYIAKT